MAVLGHIRHCVIVLLAICSPVVFSEDLSGGVPIPVSRRLNVIGAQCSRHSDCDSQYCEPTSMVCLDAPEPDDLTFSLDVGDEAVGVEWVYGANYLDAVNRLVIFLYEIDEEGNLLTNEQGLSFDDYTPGYGVLDVFSTDTFVNNPHTRMWNSRDYVIVFRQEGYNGQVKDQQTESFRPFATDCVFGPWGEWGECSSVCLDEGLGVRTRSRDIEVLKSNPNGACDIGLLMEEEECNRIPCLTSVTCSEHSDCDSQYCQPSTQLCADAPVPDDLTFSLDVGDEAVGVEWVYGANYLDAVNRLVIFLYEIDEEGNLLTNEQGLPFDDYTPGYGVLDVFSTDTFVNNPNTRMWNSRDYVIVFRQEGYNGQVKDQQTESFRPFATDCVFGPWGEWGECSSVCLDEGLGVRTRSRDIEVLKSNPNGACDIGLRMEEEECNRIPCPNGEWCSSPFATTTTPIDGGGVGGGVTIEHDGSDPNCVSSFCNANSVCDTPVYPAPVSSDVTTEVVDEGNRLTVWWSYGSDVGAIEQVRVVLLDVGAGLTVLERFFAPSITSSEFFIEYGITYQLAFFTLNEDGESPETRSPLILLSPQDCVYSEWSAWSECTVACGGGGSRFRTRTILEEASDTEGVEVCDTDSLVEEDLSCNCHTCPRMHGRRRSRGPPGEGLGAYECYSLFSEMAPDVFQDQPCPFEAEPGVLCEAPCVRDTVNALLALDVAGCPADLLDDCGDDSDCDDGEACYKENAECYPKCMGPGQSSCDNGAACTDGMCVNPEDIEEPWTYREKAMQIGEFCITNDNDNLCHEMFGMGDALYQSFDYNYCDAFRYMGCCATYLFSINPDARDLCDDPAYMPCDPCGLPDWVEEKPKIPHYNTPMEDFCQKCQPRNWDFPACISVAGYLCEEDGAKQKPYCGISCGEYDEASGEEQEICHAHVRQVALAECAGKKCEICGPDGKPLADRSWGGGKGGSAAARRRQLNFMSQLNFMTRPYKCC